MTHCILCGRLAIVYHALPLKDWREPKQRVCVICLPEYQNDQVFAAAEAIWQRWAGSPDLAAALDVQ